MASRRAIAEQPKQTRARLAEVRRRLGTTIERCIVQQTWGRIQALKVEVTGNGVIVYGHATTYYLKQLALRGVLDAIEIGGPMRIELKIQVGSLEVAAGGTPARRC
jgi:hypothetical protein